MMTIELAKLLEMVFSYAVSHRLLREEATHGVVFGMVALILGALIAIWGAL